MKTIFKLTLTVIAIAIAFTGTTQAQFVDDALRFSTYNSFITPRAGGLGISYLGVADDYSAVFYNPAGLSLIGKTEISLGLGFTRNNTETQYQGTKSTLGSNNAYFNHIGFVFPFRMKHGNGGFAIGYHLESNFSVNSKFNGFNPNSTMIDDIARNGTSNADNIAYMLFLKGDSIVRSTPVKNNLQQKAYIQKDGGLHNLSFGASFDIIEYFSVGFSLTYKFGKFKYHRTYEEFDINDKYRGQDSIDYFDDQHQLHYMGVDFKKFTLDESIEQSVSGVTGNIGIQARVKDFMRIGLAIKFPTYFGIEETFGMKADAEFDTTVFTGTGTTSPPTFSPDRKVNSYNLTTPFVFSSGVSFYVKHFTFALGFEYNDVTQSRFSSDDKYYNSWYSMDEVSFYENLNTKIAQDLNGQIRWGAGLEYDFPMIPLMLRAGYTSTSSPYIENIDGATVQTFSFGAGFYLAPNVRLDGMYQYNKYSQQYTAYGRDKFAQYILKNTPWNIGIQLTMRF